MVIKLGDTVHILGFTHKSRIFLGGGRIGRIERHRTGEISRVKQITKIYKFNPPSNTIVYLLENGKEYDLKDLQFDKELSRDNRLNDLLK